MSNFAAPLREIIWLTFLHTLYIYWLTALTVLLTNVMEVILIHAPEISDGLTHLHC
jgi:hypothetical protein